MKTSELSGHLPDHLDPGVEGGTPAKRYAKSQLRFNPLWCVRRGTSRRTMDPHLCLAQAETGSNERSVSF
ncbi:hypothetical protein, partial [Methylobacterium sp. WL7]|uniref:hypothetical protein n=1 Tax=Methylobacterium sp. WL7 TaxID=2603900 RepID=UPI001AEDD956